MQCQLSLLRSPTEASAPQLLGMIGGPLSSEPPDIDSSGQQR